MGKIHDMLKKKWVTQKDDNVKKQIDSVIAPLRNGILEINYIIALTTNCHTQHLFPGLSPD